MQTGITFSVGWFDGLFELRVSCSNGRFCGATDIYDGSFDEFANKLAGFPTSPRDSRTFQIGAPAPRFAKGGIRMHFHCADGIGHTVVDVQLRDDGCEALGELESVALRIPIEAAGVDRFIAELRPAVSNKRGTAALAMA